MIHTFFRNCGPVLAVFCAVALWALTGMGQTRDDHVKPPPERCWSYDVADLTVRLLASDNTHIYLSRIGGKLESISIESGERHWSAELGGEAASDILADSAHIFFATTSAASDASSQTVATTIRALSKDTGVTAWATKITASDQIYLGRGNGKLIAVSAKGAITALDANSGAVLWERETGRELSTPPVFGASEFAFGTVQRSIAVLSAATGEIRSEIKTRNVVSALFLDKKGRLVWGDDRGTVVSQDAAGGERRWAIKTGGRVTYVAFSEGAFLATSLDNFLYLISEDSGNVIWKRRQPGRITAAPLLTDKYAVVQTYGERSSVFVDRINGKPKNQIVLAEGRDFVQPPLRSDTRVVFVTSSGVEGYGLNGCSPK